MQNHPSGEPDPEVLPQPAAARLLARASELDVAHRAGSAVADLRAAATEAGISTRAFNAALAELHGGESASVPAIRRRTWRRSAMWILVGAIAPLLVVASYAVFRVSATPRGVAAPGAPIIEESILLRCLQPGEAAELIRPLLSLRENTVVSSPARAPRVLTIRATPAQLEAVKSLLAKQDGAGSPACAVRPK